MGKCEATGKVIFETEGLANERLKQIKSHNKISTTKRSKGRSKIKRIYYCEHCNGYHFTSYDKYNPNNELTSELKHSEQFKKYLSND